MNFEFSNRIENAKASAIREILKLMADPNIISFGGGNPAADSFPIEMITTISNYLLSNEGNKVLNYGVSEGDPKLKDEIIRYFSRNEVIKKSYDEVLITSGSQQIMDFMAKIFCNEDDVVICEQPSFIGALNAFKSNGAKLVGCSLEDDGIHLGELENAMAAFPKPKFVYLIPNFQNPTGITTSLEKRKAIYALAKKYKIIILEDNPYGELRFKGVPIPSIKSLDDEGLVVYAASLSKIIAPGMRVAMMMGHEQIIQKAVVAKQCNDVHTNGWAQSVMANFLSAVNIEEHLKHLQTIYRLKAQSMLNCMELYFHESVSWTNIEGGMFVWVSLPSGIDMLQFVKEAINRKVAIIPGNAFYTDDQISSNSFRMNFSTPSLEQIEEGVQILGELINEMIEETSN